MILVHANEATAAQRTVYFDLRDATDGLTAELTEASGQPQISTNGGAWTNTGIGTLVAIGNGRYYAVLTQAAVATAGDIIETRYKSANTVETPGDSVQVVAFNPADTVRLGLTALPNAASDAVGGLPISDAGGLDLDAILAGTNELQTDWADGGRLDVILDAIPTTAMRGTDGANTVTPPSLSSIRAGITSDHGVGSYVETSTGSYTITLTLYETGGTTPIVGQKITLQTAGGAYVDSLYTNGSGQAVFGADPDDYVLIARSVPGYAWQGTPWTTTVAAANVTVTKYGTPASPPASVDPYKCTIWDDVYNEDGELETTAGAVTITVLEVHNADAIITYTQDWQGISAQNDASGRWELEVVRGLQITLQYAGQGYERKWRLTVPDAANQRLAALTTKVRVH